LLKGYESKSKLAVLSDVIAQLTTVSVDAQDDFF